MITKLAKQLKEARAALELSKSDLSSTEAKLVVKQKVLDGLVEKITHRMSEAEKLSIEFTERKSRLEEELKQILQKLSVATDKLQKTEEQAETTRKDVAQRLLAVEKREEVVSRKEKAYRDAEAKVAEFQNYMKL